MVFTVLAELVTRVGETCPYREEPEGPTAREVGEIHSYTAPEQCQVSTLRGGM